MANFDHYGQAAPKYKATATFTPSMWDWASGVPPIKLHLVRADAKSQRYIDATNSKKNKFAVVAKGEKITPKHVARNKNATINIAIMGMLVGWDDVFIPDPAAEGQWKALDFPLLSHDDPKAPGNQMVRELLRKCGVETEAEFIRFIHNDAEWLMPLTSKPQQPGDLDEEDEEDDEDDEAVEDPQEEIVVPLDKPSATT
jgi:hypothetical protein